MKAKPIKYTQEELDFLKINKTLARAELTPLFNQQFGRNVSVKAINALMKRKGWLTGRTGQYVKGSIPMNKGTKGLMKANSGSFKKNNVPENLLPVGSESFRKDTLFIKVAEPNKWRIKARVIWEQEKGPIPKDGVILHLDSDPRNNHIDNLILVSKADVLKLNQQQFSTQIMDVRLPMVASSILDTKIKQIAARK